MFVEWSGNTVKLFNDNRSLHRIFSVRNRVINASVSGEGNDAKISIVCENGHTSLYAGTGVPIRP